MFCALKKCNTATTANSQGRVKWEALLPSRSFEPFSSRGLFEARWWVNLALLACHDRNIMLCYSAFFVFSDGVPLTDGTVVHQYLYGFLCLSEHLSSWDPVYTPYKYHQAAHWTLVHVGIKEHTSLMLLLPFPFDGGLRSFFCNCLATSFFGSLEPLLGGGVHLESIQFCFAICRLYAKH